jgi:N-acetylneuraminic acid mutarotase
MKKITSLFTHLNSNKRIRLAICLSLISIVVNAQNTWIIKTAPTPSFTARNACAGFSIGAKGYFGTGGDAVGSRADWYEYDATLDSWTKKADFAGLPRQATIYFSIGTKGYVGLGDDGSAPFADFWEYDPALDVWTKKADFPGGARTTAVGFSIGAKGYVGTGDSLGVLKKDFWEYNSVTDVWTRKTDFGGTARSDANGFAIGTRGYIGVGDDGTTPLKKDFWEYDPSLDTWTQKTDFAGGARTTATGFSLNGLGYIGAGDDGSNLHRDFWSWNPSTNTWSSITSFLGTKRSDMTAFAIGNKAYAGSGNQCGASCYINDWYEYTPATVSIKSIDEEKSNIRIFPNLVSNSLTLHYENLNGGVNTFTFFDALGNKIGTYQLLNSVNKITIDLTNLNNGLYYYQVIGNGSLMVYK